jgi:hypothetical protein
MVGQTYRDDDMRYGAMQCVCELPHLFENPDGQNKQWRALRCGHGYYHALNPHQSREGKILRQRHK